MEFFQKLATTGGGKVDITMRIMQKNNQLTVMVMPGSVKSTDKPFNLTGTGAELDEAFFTTVFPGVQEIAGLKHNLEEVKEDMKKSDKKADGKPASKDKKAAAKKKEVAKKAGKKKEEKPAPVEGDLFASPAEEATEASTEEQVTEETQS